MLSPVPEQSPKPPLSALNVLVVDDDDVMREAVQEAVVLLGYPCRSASDGLEAWEMHQREHADIILSDWQMPRMDGLELCRKTRVSEGQGAYTYFVFMTSFADKDHFVRGMDAGADDFHTKPVDFDELRARLASAERVVAVHRKLREQNALLRRDSQASFRMARIDALTQVSNRLSLDEDLKVLWARAKRYGQRFSIAMGDVDHFKAFNDGFGHLGGDEVLREVARVIRAQLRDGDGLYRYGGEEFLVVLPEQPLAVAALALERVREAIERLRLGPLRDRSVTISFGVAEIDLARDESSEGWIQRADAALYRAKASGRNCVEKDPSSKPA